MSFVRYRLGATAFIGLMTFAAAGSEEVMFAYNFRTVVTASTCDIRLGYAGDDTARAVHEVNLGEFTSHDFTSNRVRLMGKEALVMYFPDKECAGKNLTVKVEGPAARGSKGRGWGDNRRALAWGMRLSWAENGVTGSHALTPMNNTINLSVTSGRLQQVGNDAVHTVVLRPELKTWDHRRVVAGVSQTVPLVFSVMYD